MGPKYSLPFSINLMHKAFICLLMLRYISSLNFGNLKVAPDILACAFYVPTFIVGIQHIIRIVVMKIKCYNS